MYVLYVHLMYLVILYIYKNLSLPSKSTLTSQSDFEQAKACFVQLAINF